MQNWTSKAQMIAHSRTAPDHLLIAYRCPYCELLFPALHQFFTKHLPHCAMISMKLTDKTLVNCVKYLQGKNCCELPLDQRIILENNNIRIPSSINFIQDNPPKVHSTFSTIADKFWPLILKSARTLLESTASNIAKFEHEFAKLILKQDIVVQCHTYTENLLRLMFEFGVYLTQTLKMEHFFFCLSLMVDEKNQPTEKELDKIVTTYSDMCESVVTLLEKTNTTAMTFLHLNHKHLDNNCDEYPLRSLTGLIQGDQHVGPVIKEITGFFNQDCLQPKRVFDRIAHYRKQVQNVSEYTSEWGSATGEPSIDGSEGPKKIDKFMKTVSEVFNPQTKKYSFLANRQHKCSVLSLHIYTSSTMQQIAQQHIEGAISSWTKTEQQNAFATSDYKYNQDNNPHSPHYFFSKYFQQIQSDAEQSDDDYETISYDGYHAKYSPAQMEASIAESIYCHPQYSQMNFSSTVWNSMLRFIGQTRQTRQINFVSPWDFQFIYEKELESHCLTINTILEYKKNKSTNTVSLSSVFLILKECQRPGNIGHDKFQYYNGRLYPLLRHFWTKIYLITTLVYMLPKCKRDEFVNFVEQKDLPILMDDGVWEKPKMCVDMSYLNLCKVLSTLPHKYDSKHFMDFFYSSVKGANRQKLWRLFAICIPILAAGDYTRMSYLQMRRAFNC